ncbi:hypothetical protein [Sporomusa sp. KB1]|jgi:hypothetical protein|uniref:hypothetical protein n=1 Tax=Sporomusa sp. KB1 TaxID=943346 RepID=UPI00119D20B3|nr:hypothetical protein [Sporomusa sp. KB1]TWH49579.1 hypothetical protein Salpa_5817 [Sporomusa sp. KB1]
MSDEYIYTFPTGTNVSIKTPYGLKSEDIKTEITQTAKCNRCVSTYPNGLVLDISQYADLTIIKSNKKLLDNNDGTMSIEL